MMEDRDAALDEQYREDGWGLMTDQAFEGRLRPKDVESQAREVARWAYAQITAATARHNAQANELERQHRELEASAHYAGIVARQQPQIQGLRAALRLSDVEHKRTLVELARERARSASSELRLAECELVLAEHKSHVGGDMPTKLHPRALRDWLNPPDTAERCCDHE